jgi:hypothetical protein
LAYSVFKIQLAHVRIGKLLVGYPSLNSVLYLLMFFGYVGPA